MTTGDLSSPQLILGSLSWRFLSPNADPKFQERNIRIRNLSLTQGTNPTNGLLTIMERTGDHSPKLDVMGLPNASHWFRTLRTAPIAAPMRPILRAERSRLSRFNANSGPSCHLNLSTLTFDVGFSTSDVTLAQWIILTNMSIQLPSCHCQSHHDLLAVSTAD